MPKDISFAHAVRWDHLTEWLQNQHCVLKLWHGALIFMMTGGQGSWQAVGFTQLLRDCSDVRDVNYRKYCLLHLALKCMITSLLYTDHNVMLILENLIDYLDNAISERSIYFYKNLYAAVSKIPSWFYFFNCMLLYMGIEFVRLRI